MIYIRTMYQKENGKVFFFLFFIIQLYLITSSYVRIPLYICSTTVSTLQSFRVSLVVAKGWNSSSVRFFKAWPMDGSGSFRDEPQSSGRFPWCERLLGLGLACELTSSWAEPSSTRAWTSLNSFCHFDEPSSWLSPSPSLGFILFLWFVFSGMFHDSKTNFWISTPAGFYEFILCK